MHKVGDLVFHNIYGLGCIYHIQEQGHIFVCSWFEYDGPNSRGVPETTTMGPVSIEGYKRNLQVYMENQDKWVFITNQQNTK